MDGSFRKAAKSKSKWHAKKRAARHQRAAPQKRFQIIAVVGRAKSMVREPPSDSIRVKQQGDATPWWSLIRVVQAVGPATPMIPLLAAILLAGAAGAGPVLVGDACGNDTTTTDDTTSRCAVETIERSMKAKPKPAELKVSGEMAAGERNEAQRQGYGRRFRAARKAPTSTRNSNSSRGERESDVYRRAVITVASPRDSPLCKTRPRRFLTVPSHCRRHGIHVLVQCLPKCVKLVLTRRLTYDHNRLCVRSQNNCRRTFRFVLYGAIDAFFITGSPCTAVSLCFKLNSTQQ